jgi:hypothetical protein
MGHEFLGRVRKTSIILALILFPVLSTYLGIAFGTACLVGAAWSLVNLHMIGGLIKRIFAPAKKNHWIISLVFFAKFPVLYFVGFLILQNSWFPISALLAGFMWPFFVMTMKALGRLYLRLDESDGFRLRIKSDSNAT